MNHDEEIRRLERELQAAKDAKKRADEEAKLPQLVREWLATLTVEDGSKRVYGQTVCRYLNWLDRESDPKR
jgi:hypothetical protein